MQWILFLCEAYIYYCLQRQLFEIVGWTFQKMDGLVMYCCICQSYFLTFSSLWCYLVRIRDDLKREMNSNEGSSQNTESLMHDTTWKWWNWTFNLRLLSPVHHSTELWITPTYVQLQQLCISIVSTKRSRSALLQIIIEKLNNVSGKIRQCVTPNKTV